jgi:hypothetical protein
MLCAAAVWLLTPAQADAQVGIGGRFATIRGDVDAGTDSVRFKGGQLRAGLSRRLSVELSLDVKTTTSEDETVRVRDLPFQASLLLFPTRGTIAPYLLGGVGWYSKRVEALDLDGAVSETVTTRTRGFHAGFGAELRLGKHAGLHGDYRYTNLNFNNDQADKGSVVGGILNPVSRFLPSYEGSMWTVGFTVYF